MRAKKLQLFVALLVVSYWLTFFLYHSVNWTAFAADEKAVDSATSSPHASCMIEAEISGAIGPASLDFLQRAQKRVEKNKCSSLLLLINTPGGNLQTTRLMVENILASPVPVLCMVHPAGAHAGSAGAILLLACHLSGAIDTTNIGAATPISGDGKELPEDLRKKMINDTTAWVQSLAKLRGRNEEYAKQIVTDAKSVTAKEAVQLKAIEFSGTSVADFIKYAEGKKVKLNENTETTIKSGEKIVFKQDVRFKFMDLFMNPQLAYLIFMGSLGLLYYELTHPGAIAPGVIGGIGLIISLMSLHMMEAYWGGVALIFLGIAFMVAEAFVAGFGILGIGGIFAFFAGSMFLFDPETTGYQLPLSLILPTTILLGLLMIGVAYLAFSTRKLRKQGAADDFVGEVAKVTEVQPGDGKCGYAEVAGEYWKCVSEQPLKVGDQVYVKGNKGLTLIVSHTKENT